MSGSEGGPQSAHKATGDAASRQNPGHSRNTKLPSAAYIPATGRLPIPTLNVSLPDMASYPSPGADRKTLVVGRDISLNGQIMACDKLVVEGSVEADLNESQIIEISRHGHFKGTAVIDEADISGHFEGDLTVRKHLVVRSTGKIYGTIKYSRLEIEAGGEISGKINVLPGTTESLDASPPCGPAAADDLKEHTTEGSPERQQAR
ncbi:MAG: polymer-forming cytoskeletal protein [Alphaproteobacteria bacterium]